MRLHKLQAGETPGTYRIKDPQALLTEEDIFQMALSQHEQGLTSLIRYFSKSDQRLRLYPPRTRSSGRGQLPKQ